MTLRLKFVLLLIGVLLIPMFYGLVKANALALRSQSSVSLNDALIQSSGTRRVNAPYFDGNIGFPETAIFWFGRVTSYENSVDARIGYNNDYLYVRVGVFDRRLWYDTSPSPADLTDWDAVSLYLDLDGNQGSVPDSNAHRFDAQLVWWQDRQPYEAAYVGNGAAWVAATTPFTTTSFWRGNVPGDDVDDRGWALTYYIPFDSLGLGGPPAEGTVWGMALTQYDRDDSGGAITSEQQWPETLAGQQPSTWGQLRFGMPSYSPQPAILDGSTVIRHGLNGAVVMDADVGGSSTCGNLAKPNYFPTWGDLNYASKEFINIQNLGDINDWPCFSKYYVDFSLDSVPANKVIISATLTLIQFGNAGSGGQPQPSYIQVHTVDQAWNESTITWNNAPLAVENVAGTWAGVYPSLPGEARTWDVSRVASEAHTAGTPLRLALYESDWHYHSGKYFWSSDFPDEEYRPSLTVTWGRAVVDLEKNAYPSAADQGDQITYTLDLVGSGNTLYLTDTLPAGIGAPASFQLDGTSVTPVYNSSQHLLTWTDTPPIGQEVAIRYTVDILTDETTTLINTAALREAGGDISGDSATVFANPCLVFLPITLRDGP